ncbi:methyltransferase domain-containing protein [Maribacter ulvicola]|uniref:Methyltransferase domain-containing protein n=1 Tax=Maribacter ulvicola TaxID=228959 RepID=A0A1N6Y594_9FLAO|nr:methyltransferase domain-containing protein [Maribacter ulvicola]SIR09723.1 Methyltransferase domain-containing protein [Maribacter ulvicola]
MELKRAPFQGVINIIRFNWHFYVIAVLLLLFALGLQIIAPFYLQRILFWSTLLGTITIIISLLVSYYIYDYSSLYQLSWLPNLNDKKVLNINAGFDETSEIIRGDFTNIELTKCDFYDSKKHTEVSIERARLLYPPSRDTIKVNTHKLPFKDNTFSVVIVMFSAHEIRNTEERELFFKELVRVMKEDGQIFVTEHLRDSFNFMAYTIGFFHFYSKSSWLQTFKNAGLSLIKEKKNTPFVSTFILQENGDTN